MKPRVVWRRGPVRVEIVPASRLNTGVWTEPHYQLEIDGRHPPVGAIWPGPPAPPPTRAQVLHEVRNRARQVDAGVLYNPSRGAYTAVVPTLSVRRYGYDAYTLSGWTYVDASDWAGVRAARAQAERECERQRRRVQLILRNVERRAHLRARDGALVGMRWWRLHPTGLLQSPHQWTVWDGPALVARGWSDSAAVRGETGIHAALPSGVRMAIRGLAWQLRDTWYSEMDIMVLGRVRGYGRYVLGRDGWRAERVLVDRLYVTPRVSPETRAMWEDRYQCDVRVVPILLSPWKACVSGA